MTLVASHAVENAVSLVNAGGVADRLLPMLVTSVDLVEAREVLFGTMRSLLPWCTRDYSSLVSRLFGPLLRTPITERAERLALVEVLGAFQSTPGWASAHVLLRDLNAYADGRADNEVDFAKRMRAYEVLSPISLIVHL